MVRRRLLLVVAMAAIWVTTSWVRPAAPPTPVAVVGHTGLSLPQDVAPAATDAPPTTAVLLPPPTARATASQSSTVIETDGGRGVTVVNSGSATASTGGNIVVGSDQPGGQATVVNGPVTAVGNSSDVRVVSRP